MLVPDLSTLEMAPISVGKLGGAYRPKGRLGPLSKVYYYYIGECWLLGVQITASDLSSTEEGEANQQAHSNQSIGTTKYTRWDTLGTRWLTRRGSP